MISANTIVVAVPDQVSSHLANETVILHFDAGAYYGLNFVGSRIWGLIQQPVSVGDVVAVLLGEFDVTPAACAREVLAFLNRLGERGLLTTHEPAGAAA